MRSVRGNMILGAALASVLGLGILGALSISPTLAPANDAAADSQSRLAAGMPYEVYGGGLVARVLAVGVPY